MQHVNRLPNSCVIAVTHHPIQEILPRNVAPMVISI